MSNSVRPHRWQSTRLPSPWDSPGKNTGVGCHFLLQCMKVKSESEVTQSCLTLSDPMDCSPPGSSIHGIFQARVLEWGAIAFSYEGKKKVLLFWATQFVVVPQSNHRKTDIPSQTFEPYSCLPDILDLVFSDDLSKLTEVAPLSLSHNHRGPCKYHHTFFILGMQ